MSPRTDPNEAFEALRARLGDDLRPVKPFLPSRWMALFLAIFAPVCVIYLGQRFGWRSDYDLLGSPWVWGLSALELVVAGTLLFHVLREAVPGRRTSLALIGFSAAGAVVLHGAVSLATWYRSPMSPAAEHAWAAGVYCFAYEVALAVPCVLFALWLGRRGLTPNPWRLALLGGIGSGLAGDALWRLVCPYTNPGHAFGSHSLGIVAIVGVGLLLAAGWESARSRSWRVAASR